MTNRQKPLPPSLRDGQYRSWDVEMMKRFPLTLTEMRSPSVHLQMVETQPLARWGIDINVGWRSIMERLLARLEAVIAVQPPDERDRFRILQVKEKFGRLTVYLADSIAEMDAAIHEASEESIRTCEVCGAAGVLDERHAWWSPRCKAHEAWTPYARLP
jgi:hypothetical protein